MVVLLETLSCNVCSRYDFATESSQTLSIENAWSYGRNYLFRMAKSYFKVAVDENGLWVMYFSVPDEYIMVARVEEETFSVLRLTNTTYPKSKAGHAFVTCGVLYITDTSYRHVTFAFDLLKEKQVDASVEFQLASVMQQLNASAEAKEATVSLAMLSYNPADKHLYTWEDGSLLQYPIHFIS